MYGFGFGMPIDIENDEDDMLVMRLSSLYRSCQQYKSPQLQKHGVSDGWFKSGVHKDLVSVCNKFDDKEWFGKGQNWYCIYYACSILCSMANFSEYGALCIVNEPNIVSTLLRLWRGDLSWIESRCAVKTISAILFSAPQLATRFINNSQNINVIQLAFTQYSQWCVCMSLSNKSIKK